MIVRVLGVSVTKVFGSFFSSGYWQDTPKVFCSKSANSVEISASYICWLSAAGIVLNIFNIAY